MKFAEVVAVGLYNWSLKANSDGPWFPAAQPCYCNGYRPGDSRVR